MQKAGRKPRGSRRYRRKTRQVRGFVRTGINRVLNRLVGRLKPGALILERLDFRAPELSRRLSLVIRNCGRATIRAKLKALEEEFGIASEAVNPAYTSQ